MRAPRALLGLASTLASALPLGCHQIVGIEEREPKEKRYEDVVRDDGPIVYLRFEEISGGAVDAISQREVGSIWYFDGTTSQPDPDGEHVVRRPDSASKELGRSITLFTDVTRTHGGYVALTDAPPEIAFAGDAPFTIEFWGQFELDVEIDDFAHPISNVDAASDGYVVEVSHAKDSGVYAAGSRGTDALSDFPVYVGFDASIFHHYVLTYAGNGAGTMYVDGAPGVCLLCAGGVTIGSRDSLLTIGGRWLGDEDPAANGAFVHGTIDEVAIYDHALSAERVMAHYSAAKIER